MRNGIKEIIHQLLDSAIWKFKVSFKENYELPELKWCGKSNFPLSI